MNTEYALQYPHDPAFPIEYVEQELKKLTNRELQWAAGYMKNKYPSYTIPVGTNDLLKYVSVFIMMSGNERKFTFKNLLQSRHTLLIPEKNIEWLKNNVRATAFTYFYLEESYQLIYEDFYDNTYIELIYSSLDSTINLIPTVQNSNIRTILNLEDKILLINDIELKLKQIVAATNYEKWLEKESDEYIHWIYNYMKNKVSSFIRYGVASDRRTNTIKILSGLDFLDWNYVYKNFPPGDYKPSDSKMRFVEKMKRALSQQKYRDAGKTKTQYHLPLTKKTKARLDKMASVQATSSTEILDILINLAYEADYLDDKGKDKY